MLLLLGDGLGWLGPLELPALELLDELDPESDFSADWFLVLEELLPEAFCEVGALLDGDFFANWR